MSTAPGLPPQASAEPALPRLQVANLSTSFATGQGRIQSVADVSFSIMPGQTLALVGESGSGKSVTSLSLMGLHAKTSQAQVSGQAWFERRDASRVDLLALPEAARRSLRGNEMAMIFQEPMTSLNPVLTVGEQIAESVRLHLRMDRGAARAHARRMLELVEIPAAAQRLGEYPHQLSGGMRQRVMIALAMACNPSLLIADEPTTALDVTIQAQILALMGRLQRETGMSLLFITHNLAVVAQYADAVAVMYAGRIVESADVHALFGQPAHPYTRGLLACLPGVARRRGAGRKLSAIPGQVFSPAAIPPGCAFAPRCAEKTPACDQAMPGLHDYAAQRMVRCIHVESAR
ncbi:ABC transporter ATP-binding protein [Bordetella genomosp. 6]|uniref:ABC transporter ATP-binding protein n=1 Tax=Bordetella genomosp. 6 TaxID=463024 RepID=UPI000A293F94|nr:ABC transporter ATP-binding protein [Bordetella genomosp. 6]ARP78731.1 dipeptide ABC transporter ATP-binding protein DppD [Bordetella genomosp. 6]